MLFAVVESLLLKMIGVVEVPLLVKVVDTVNGDALRANLDFALKTSVPIVALLPFHSMKQQPLVSVIVIVL